MGTKDIKSTTMKKGPDEESKKLSTMAREQREQVQNTRKKLGPLETLKKSPTGGEDDSNVECYADNRMNPIRIMMTMPGPRKEQGMAKGTTTRRGRARTLGRNKKQQ